jgi:hypothetical protein
MTMTTEQKSEAVQQMIAHCRLLMEQYEQGGRYESVSARGVLYTLGFEAEVNEVLAFIAEGGFAYCLDAEVGATERHGERPPRHACYWGADQLESRLQCLSNVRSPR